MAGRILNRRELRRQADEAAIAGQIGEEAESTSETAVASRAAESAIKPKPRKPRAKKAPPRMRARWGIFDVNMKQVAIFDYNQRAAAEERLADLLTAKRGTHFLQIVKEPLPESVPPGTAQ